MELVLRQDESTVPLCGGVARSAGVVREFENIHLPTFPCYWCAVCFVEKIMQNT